MFPSNDRYYLHKSFSYDKNSILNFLYSFRNKLKTNLFYLIRMINNYAQITPKYDSVYIILICCLKYHFSGLKTILAN